MTDQPTKDDVKEKIEYKSIAEFLESTPPNQFTHISDLSNKTEKRNLNTFSIMKTPQIKLHCTDESCDGIRIFRCVSDGEQYLNSEKYELFYLKYRCYNCLKVDKTFSLIAKVNYHNTPQGVCYKFGELPTYGPPVPSKLISLIRDDKEEFLKGRRCENQGLGVGAFSYYRRVVVNQKNRIIEKIIKISEKISAPEDKLKILHDSVNETQFTKALKMAKDAMPESLLINGHSPLLLLHNALSEGMHALTDKQCLELASTVRVVLGELSNRLSQALKDDAEIKKALTTLMNKKELTVKSKGTANKEIK